MRVQINKDQIEKQLSGNSLRTAWQGMKAMACCKVYRGDRDIKLKEYSFAKQFAEELNTFYLRFDDNDFKSETDFLKWDLACSQFFNISMIQVKGL